MPLSASTDYNTRESGEDASVYVTNNEMVTIRQSGMPGGIQYNTGTNTISIMGPDGVFASIQIETDQNNIPYDLIIDGVKQGVTRVTPEERRALSGNNMQYGTTPEDLRNIV